MALWGRPLVLVYDVDQYDDLNYFDGPWNLFAAENGAPELLMDSLLGNQLWKHITGMETRHIYQSLMGKAREKRCKMEFSYRCDAPDTLRVLKLEISSENGQEVRFRSTLLHESLRTIAYPFLPPDPYAKSALFHSVCSVCKKLLQEGKWVELETAVEDLRLLHEASNYALSHTLCPHCAHALHYLMEATA